MKGTVMDITERHSLLEKLKQSENLYKQAQTLAHLGNWTMDLESNQFSWSNEMFNIYETEADKKIYLNDWLDFIHPEDRNEVSDYLRECIREKII